MVDLGDFGADKQVQDTDDYVVLYNSDLDVGDTIEGEIFLSDIKDHENEDHKISRLLTLVITNHEAEEKWIIGYWNPKEIDDEGKPKKIYGKKGGKLYNLIDDVLTGIWKDLPKQEAKYHSVEFDKFREGINSKILSVKAEAVPPTHRLAEHPNITIKEITVAPTGE